jgi:hypothetical protein
MKNKVCGISFVVCLLLASSVCGQLSGWASYITTIKGRQASVLADVDLFGLPHTATPFLVITGPVKKDCGETGIPAGEEIARMEDILETTTTILTGTTKFALAGTVTANCARLNCYYVKDTSAIRAVLRKMYDRSFKTYEYMVQCSYDSNWNYYNKVLYPDEEMQEWIINSRQYTRSMASTSMRSNTTDTLGRKDVLNIAACFASDTVSAAFNSWAVNAGFTVQKNRKLNNTTTPWCTVISRDITVRIDSVSRYTLSVKKRLRDSGGVWGGWQLKGR